MMTRRGDQRVPENKNDWTLHKVADVRLPPPDTVAIVISDGTVFRVAEVKRSDFLLDGAAQSILDFLDAEMSVMPRPIDRLRQAIDNVTEYRNPQE
jgi:hypothetical protein